MLPIRECGCHTFSLTVKSNYTEIQNIRANKLCVLKGYDKYYLNTSYEITKFKDTGVEIHLYQSLVHPSWISLIITPSSLLAGEYRPTELLSDVSKIPEIKQQLREILDECGIKRRLKEFKLSRVDLTENRYYFDSQQMNEDLEIYKKSFLISAYKVVSFEEFHGATFQAKESDKHSWTIRCKTKTEFSVYDKACELATRHGVDIDDKILRLELRLERKRIQQLSKNSCWEDQLKYAITHQKKLFYKFLHRLHQDFDHSVPLEESLQTIKDAAFREKTKKKLRKLVKLADQCESLAEVQKEMRLNRKDFIRLLDRFYKLGINPIPRKST